MTPARTGESLARPGLLPAGHAPHRGIADMTGATALPRKNGELVFDEAWQGRTFGMTVAMSHDARFEWPEFQARLIAEIAHAEAEGHGSSYYDRWLAAFERLLRDKGFVAPEELARRTHELAIGRRDDVF
jgi:nitrile hydratase accessory protein